MYKLIYYIIYCSANVHAKSLQSCPTLCDPMDYSPPGSSVQGILWARILEWVAVPSSRDLPEPGIEPASPASPALQVDSWPLGKPTELSYILFFKLCRRKMEGSHLVSDSHTKRCDVLKNMIITFLLPQHSMVSQSMHSCAYLIQIN